MNAVDKWEEKIQGTMGMSEDEQKKMMKQNMDMCRCPQCPTHDQCAKEKNELLYCSIKRGKSACDLSMKGCLCPDCPVKANMGLRYSYYCLLGNEKEQRGSLTTIR